MPFIGLLIGGINFQDLSFTFYEAKVTYGAFLQSVVDFTIITFSIFLFVKLINRLKINQPSVEKVVKKEQTEELLTEIRDLLKEKNHKKTTPSVHY